MSKKLEKNGIWESSRMMLPQHKEALQHRRTEKQAALKPPKREDLELMRDSILLPVMVSIVKKRIRAIEGSGEALKSLYSKVARILAQQIERDFVKVERIMLEKNVYVFEEDKDPGAIRYRYNFNEYEDTFTMTRDYMRTEVSMRIGRYTDRLIAALYARIQDERQG